MLVWSVQKGLFVGSLFKFEGIALEMTGGRECCGKFYLGAFEQQDYPLDMGGVQTSFCLECACFRKHWRAMEVCRVEESRLEKALSRLNPAQDWKHPPASCRGAQDLVGVPPLEPPFKPSRNDCFAAGRKAPVRSCRANATLPVLKCCFGFL